MKIIKWHEITKTDVLNNKLNFWNHGQTQEYMYIIIGYSPQAVLHNNIWSDNSIDILSYNYHAHTSEYNDIVK